MGGSRKKHGGLGETIRTVVYAVLIALVVRTLAFEPFNIPSKSMVPTLLVGDYLFVAKYSYGYSRHSMPLSLHLFDGRVFFKMPERGDVAVFKVPSDNRTDYIKRVIGLPGDHIQVIHRVLYINGKATERKQIEDYVERDPRGGAQIFTQYIETLPEGRTHLIIEYPGSESTADNTPEYVVPPNHYFMMGDNRDNSQDSRFLGAVGYVPEENLVGRAEIIFFSADGSAALWELWRWPWAIRWDRFLTLIH
ncbi:MAG TPA: signal peptidase I [Rhodospirillaceae bacterium]|nr:signal peptidase I [Rhodospirillaceae bacterium]